MADTSYRADIQDVANAAIDDGVTDAAIDAMVAEKAAAHGVEPDTFAGDVEERVDEMRELRQQERRDLEG